MKVGYDITVGIGRALVNIFPWYEYKKLLTFELLKNICVKERF